jgi:chromate reductase, NAD(P)H dehydrogenase (quinone)
LYYTKYSNKRKGIFNMTQIAVFVGSLRADSLNKKLANNLETLAPAGTEFVYVDISTLPLFSQETETDFPASATAMKDIVEAADGVLFATPEYNRSIPGVLKNAIDWASRPWGSNSFNGKPAGIVGASVGPLGTAPAQAHLKDILVYLGTKLMGQPEVYFSNSTDLFDQDGTVVEGSREFLQNYITTFVAHIDSQK